MADNPQENLPAACAECLTSTQLAHAPDPSQYASKVSRSADGKFRVDGADFSVITDPQKRHTILLDHLKKEARIIPMDQALPGLAIPGGIPQPPPLPTLPPPPLKIEDLGKSIIDGHDVFGKRYTIPQPNLPGTPSLQPPGLPGAPSPLNTVEVWTSSRLQMPVLTKTTGPFGEQIQRCKVTDLVHAPPTMFDPPPDYKQIASSAAPKLK